MKAEKKVFNDKPIIFERHAPLIMEWETMVEDQFLPPQPLQALPKVYNGIHMATIFSS